MLHEGKITLFRFPQTNQKTGKLRPALLVRELPTKYEDWLVCMISSRTDQYIPGFDELILDTDSEFEETGLKHSSVIRITRLAVVEESIFVGSVGNITNERLSKIHHTLANWLVGL